LRIELAVHFDAIRALWTSRSRIVVGDGRIADLRMPACGPATDWSAPWNGGHKRSSQISRKLRPLAIVQRGHCEVIHQQKHRCGAIEVQQNRPRLPSARASARSRNSLAADR